MSHIECAGLKIAGYKSFNETGITIEHIAPINIVIGRNNSGKSAIIDSIEYVCRPFAIPHFQRHPSCETSIAIIKPLTKGEVAPLFGTNVHGGIVPGNHWDQVGKHLVGKNIIMRVGESGSLTYESISPSISEIVPYNINASHLQLFGNIVKNPFCTFQFFRLLAERDISPEAARSKVEVSPNGAGFSQSVAHILNNVALPSALIEEKLLGAVNTIFSSDSIFTRIRVQQHDDGRWEVILDEQSKGGILLSNSGSGLKTIMLICMFIECMPFFSKADLKSHIFAFEELENNLHPALQRRLMQYLRRVAVDRGATIFITTHSSVVIDSFSKDENAQILHVSHDGAKANCRLAMTYIEHKGILDDLDVRASDLLQSNSVVWVEGPSDRLYFNRWVDLFTGGRLKEGLHYQCVIYGGRLLSHLSADDPDLADEAINIMRINRNAIVLIDSDKKSKKSAINETKSRISSEVARNGGLAWITHGKEIENYLPLDALNSSGINAAIGPGQYADFADFLDATQLGLGIKYLNSKVLFAERIVPYLKKESLEGVMDWTEQMQRVTAAITRWNGLRAL